MQILVLDTIHGGQVIADRLRSAGHQIDTIDVYRGTGGISPGQAAERTYDLVIKPVHLDPCYPLLRSLTAPVISHHQAVRWILGKIPGPSVEITGARGKTTTGSALALILSSALPEGVLHSSRGIIRYPENEPVEKLSITPASVLAAARYLPEGGWFIAEVSLGVCGIGSLAIITSPDDYPVASGRLSALDLKLQSGFSSPLLLLAPGIVSSHDNAVRAGDLVQVQGNTAIYQYKGKRCSFTNPLLVLDGYKEPLMLATAAGILLGYDPSVLSGFTGVSGRMQVRREGGKMVIDNANSGTCHKTTIEAAMYARSLSPGSGMVLVIGQEEHAVCENFAVNDILETVLEVIPEELILVSGGVKDAGAIPYICHNQKIPVKSVTSLTEGIDRAKESSHPVVVLSVKTWR